MTANSRRHARRAVLTGGLLAASLIAAAPASAALGGANPASYNHVPDLRSVTFGESGPDLVAWFTFDEPLASNAIDPTQFTLGGYASSQRVPTADAASVVGSKPNTVELRWTSNDVDFDETSYGVVNAGAVRAFNGNQPNRVDSTAVTGAKGESGTRAHSVRPDLVGVRVDESNLNANVLIFTYDQRIDPGSANPGQFWFVKQDGQTAVGGSIASASGYEVAVRFPSLPGDDLVTEAVKAADFGGGITSVNYGNASFPGSVAVSGTSGLTAMPDLLSTEFVGGGGSASVVYHYDEPVANPIAGAFAAVTAAGGLLPGASAVVNADGKSVTVNFPNVPAVKAHEHFVRAAGFAGAVTNVNGVPNIGQSTPIGGNAGAKSTGWTSAPDATAATFNKQNGQVDVTVDARLTIPSVDPTQFTLVDANGDTVVAGAQSVISQGSDGAPGPQTIRLQFLPNQVAAASAIEINGWNAPFGNSGGFAFIGSNPVPDNVNALPVAQSLSAAASAAAIAPVGTSKKVLKLRKVKTVGVLPAKVRKALKPAKSAKQARANAKVLKAFYATSKRASAYKVKKVAVRKAAKKR
ncbi:hypothetical protein [Patulibacter defluvii]|uniref:hypothetical protein n=1 Tax=Patulibacter defluvii TaxID=3095358 RepID=UPI002A761E27|nr:hypothetical protein [Patulibacter sp. DM4]